MKTIIMAVVQQFELHLKPSIMQLHVLAVKLYFMNIIIKTKKFQVIHQLLLSNQMAKLARAAVCLNKGPCVRRCPGHISCVDVCSLNGIYVQSPCISSI